MKTFINVAQMKLATLQAGQFVETGGYYVKGDAGQARYLIKAAQAFDGYGDHELVNGTIAVLQVGGDINAKQFGAKGDGATDDTLAIQAAIDAASAKGGGKISLEAATYRASGLVMKTGVIIRGVNFDDSKIVAPDGWSTGNVCDSFNFDTYVYANTDANTPHSCGFQDVTIDGNHANYAGVATATEGCCYRMAVYRPHMLRVRITGAPGMGFHSGLRGMTRTDARWYEDQTKLGTMSQIKVFGCLNDGWVFDGPSDHFLDLVECGVNGWPDNVGYTVSRPSLIEPTRRVSNLTLNTAVELGWWHSFGCTEGHGIVIGRPSYGSGTIRIKWNMGISESCDRGFWAREGARYQGGILDMHNIYGASGQPQFLDDGNVLQSYLENLEVVCDPVNDNGQNKVQLKGDNTTIGHITLDGNNSEGDGVILEGFNNKVIDADIQKLINGSSSGVRITAAASQWSIKATVRDCQRIASATTGAGAPLSSHIVGEFGNIESFNNFDQFNFSERRNMLLHNLSGDKRSRGYAGVSANINADVLTLKTIDVPIDSELAPLAEEIQVSLVYVSGATADVSLLQVSEPNIVNGLLKVFLQFGTTGSGVFKIVATVA
jgi:hypothetical protein